MSSTNSIAYVEVTNRDQLIAAIKPFLPGADSSIRSDLLNGFEIVKNRMRAYQQSIIAVNSSEFGMHPPAPLANPDESKFWLDQIIERRMGGARCGMVIRWVLPSGTYTFEPYTGKLECSQSQ